jgi:molybdenum cofactor cytidylyltransferase
MKLLHALRLGENPRLALVGAGGKTTAMFSLARELLEARRSNGAETVVVSATTHLARGQLSLADHHFYVETPRDVAELRGRLPEGVVLLTGREVEDERTAGLDLTLMEKVLELVGVGENGTSPGSMRAARLPLLIEADGSRQRPVKASGGHEPALPHWVDTVVVVAGLSALGKPLAADWVHRPELFASLCGQPSGSEITIEALSRVLTSPMGGLKNIPDGARRVVLLNQADTLDQQAQAQRLAELLRAEYSSVLIASLKAPDPSNEVFAVSERDAAIVLAAGASSRFGQPKQLLDWRGEPFVRHVACTAINAGLSSVTVVTGAHAELVQAALKGLPVQIVFNPRWEEGQSTSVAAGVRSLPEGTGAAIFMLSDQPQVPERLLRSLVELHQRSLSPLVAPQADGRRANPVLFDRIVFPQLLELTGDSGGRALFNRYKAEWLPWHDPSLILDVDTFEDYQLLLETSD